MITKFKLDIKVWQLAWPIILSNLSIPLLGLVDTMVVGHMPTAIDLATVALGTTVFNIIFWCFGFLRMSTTSMVAQNPKNLYFYYHSICMALGIAIFIIACQPIIIKMVLYAVTTNDSVESLLGAYIRIRIYSAIPTLINYVSIGYLFGRQQTKKTLILLWATNGSIIILDIILVWVLQLGACGTAFANLFGQCLGASIGFIIIYKKFLKQVSFRQSLKHLADFNLKLMLSMNTNIFIRTLVLVLITAFFTRQSAFLGVNIVAANMILMNLQMLTSYTCDGFAIAAEVLIGNSIGKKNLIRFNRQAQACFAWAFVIGLSLMVIYLCFGSKIIMMMTSINDIKQKAFDMLPWVIILAILSMPAFIFDGIFLGAAWSKPLRNAAIFSSLGVFFPIWYLTRPLQNQGLWIAYTALMVSRGVYLGLNLKKYLFKTFASNHTIF